MVQSTVAVYSSVDMVTSSRKVAELLQDEERNARVYNVLGEPAQLQEVNKIHQDIEQALEILVTFNNDEQLVQLIEELKFKENYIVVVLNSAAIDPEQIKKEQEQVLSLYQDLTN